MHTYLHFTIQLLVCIDTLYEENSLNSTTMLARQSSQSFYDQINHRLKDCVINCSPSADVNATSKDANIPGRFVFPVILFVSQLVFVRLAH